VRVLVIDEKAREKIKQVINYAKAHPIKKNILISGFVVGNTKSYCCDFIDGFHVVFSVEEQPAGWSYHLSISIPDRTKLPSQESAGMLMQEFGLSENGDIHDASDFWIDEKSLPMSINLIKLIDDEKLLQELTNVKS